MVYGDYDEPSGEGVWMGGARVVDSYVQLRNPVNVQAGGQSKSAVDVIGPDGSRPPGTSSGTGASGT